MCGHAGADWDASLAGLFEQLKASTSTVTYEQLRRNGEDATAPSFNLEVCCCLQQGPCRLGCMSA